MYDAPALAGEIPEWTLADRMRKAREHAGLKQSQLAEMIGIARSSIVNYEAGRTVPSKPVLLSWALATGVPFTWLRGTEFPQVTGGFKMTCTWTQKLAKIIALPVAA